MNKKIVNQVRYSNCSHHSLLCPITNKNMNTKTYKILLYGYSTLLILLAVLPINGESSAINHTYVVSVRLDYLVHFAIFIPWVFLAQMTNDLSFRNYPMKTLKWLFLGILFATANEAIQYFIPWRSYNINDLVSNFIGVLLGAMLFLSGFVPIPGFLKSKV
jgi:VanZ family protein